MWTKRILFLLILVAGIGVASAETVSMRGVKGNGRMQREQRQVGRFDRIVSLGSMDVRVQQSPSAQGVVVEAEANVLPLVETMVRGGVLTIKYKSGSSFSTRRGVRITVTTPVLRSAELRGSGDLHFARGFRQPSLEVSLAGSGDVSFADAAIDGDLLVNVKGSGDVEGQVMTGGNVRITLLGSGDVSLSLGRPQSVGASLNGSGDVNLRGETLHAVLSSAGSGDISCRQLTARRAEVTFRGSGDGELSVIERLDIRLTGSSDFVCYGKPAIGEHQVSRSASFRTVPRKP